MKKTVLVLAATSCLCFLSMLSIAQPSIQWQKCLGGTACDKAISTQQTSDKGYIVAGYTLSNSGDVTEYQGNQDFWVVKLDSAGSIQWQKCLGGTSYDGATSVKQTKDGGYIITGFSDSNDGDVAGNHGQYGQTDYWVIKISSKGEFEWQKCLGGSKNDEANSIQQTGDGGYIVLGWTQSENRNVSGNHGGDDCWVVKLSPKGEMQWQKCLGGSSDEGAYFIQLASDGGYVIAAYTKSNDGDVKGNHGGWDYWVVKLSSTGSIQWQKCLGGSGDDYASSVQQTKDKGYIVSGRTKSNDGDVSGNHSTENYDYWIVKLDSVGGLQWQKCVGGSKNDEANFVRQTDDGGYVAIGESNSSDGDMTENRGGSDCWAIKFSPEGSIQWKKCMGGSKGEEAYSIEQTHDKGFVIAGYTWSKDGDVSGKHDPGLEDYWVIKLGPASK